MAQKSLDLIEEMRARIAHVQPARPSARKRPCARGRTFAEYDRLVRDGNSEVWQ
jgi:hypothetical protein